MNTERSVSLILLVVYALFAWRSANVFAFLATLGVGCIPLALIWFPEQIGSYTGWVGSLRTVNRESPASMVRVFGWILLIVPALVMSLAAMRG